MKKHAYSPKLVRITDKIGDDLHSSCQPMEDFQAVVRGRRIPDAPITPHDEASHEQNHNDSRLIVILMMMACLIAGIGIGIAFS